MSIDSFTISAVAVVLFVIVVLAWSSIRARKAEAQIAELRARLDSVSSGSLVSNAGARQLCRAVRCLYPAAQVGVDFSIADGGDGPYIDQWSLLVPQPDDERLKQAMLECKTATETSRYREERAFAYPPIGDQLDALYKARYGDTADLDALDSQIAEVKQRYPKPDSC